MCNFIYDISYMMYIYVYYLLAFGLLPPALISWTQSPTFTVSGGHAPSFRTDREHRNRDRVKHRSDWKKERRSHGFLGVPWHDMTRRHVMTRWHVMAWWHVIPWWYLMTRWHVMTCGHVMTWWQVMTWWHVTTWWHAMTRWEGMTGARIGLYLAPNEPNGAQMLSLIHIWRCRRRG